MYKVTHYLFDLKKPSEWVRILTSQKWKPKPFNYLIGLSFQDPYNNFVYCFTESIVKMLYRNKETYEKEISKVEKLALFNFDIRITSFTIENAKRDAEIISIYKSGYQY